MSRSHALRSARARRADAPAFRVAALTALAMVTLAGFGSSAWASVSPAAAESSGTVSSVPDFTGYQKLLDQYLRVLPGPRGGPLDTQFDYEQLYVDEHLFKSSVGSRRLDRLHASLTEVAPSRMDARTRRAWAINTYNGLVLEFATRNLLIGRTRTRYRSVQEMRSSLFFEATSAVIEGQKYSLNAFERHFLFDDYERGSGPPPPDLDPRVHFAIVCGAKGCPPLLPRAFKPESLEAQLAFATRNALRLPRHLRWIESPSSLEGSSIFDWYAHDFGGPDSAFAFAMRNGPREIRAQAQKWRLHAFTRSIEWDWWINQAPRRNVPAPKKTSQDTSGLAPRTPPENRANSSAPSGF